MSRAAPPRRPRPRLRWLAACLLAGAPGWAAAQAGDGLPPEPVLRQALQQAPQAAAADAAWQAGQSAAEQTRLSPYDWVLRAGLQRRSEREGARFAEREIALERTLRWGGKAALDGRLADQSLALATLQRRLAWHEAAQALLATWFDTLRDAQAAAHHQAQLALAEAQLAALRRRVAAGDAPLLAQRQAEGERDRSAAALASAAQRADASRQALLQAYPGLAPHLPAPGTGLAGPAALPDAPPVDAGGEAALVRQIVDQHPALAEARGQTALARLQLSRVQADRQADPTLGLRFAQERGGAERVLGLTVSLPFGTAARDQRARSGEAALALAEAQLRVLQARLESDAARLAAAPARHRLIHDRLQAAAAAADTSARLTERAQVAGEATLADLLQQRRQAGEAALAAGLARLDALEAQARLRLALQPWLPAT